MVARRPPATPAQQQLQAAVEDCIQQWLETSGLLSQIQPGVVTSVTAGAAEGGATLVRVNFAGVELPIAHLASYTPAPGHVVAIARTGSVPLILGRITGVPS